MLSHAVTSSQETYVNVHGCVYSYRYIIIYYPMFGYLMVLILQKWHILCRGTLHSSELGSPNTMLGVTRTAGGMTDCVTVTQGTDFDSLTRFMQGIDIIFCVIRCCLVDTSV